MAKLESKNNNNLCCYLSNKYDHYFTVKGPLDTDKLAGCTVYPSLGVLYEAMASVSSMSLEEIEHSEINLYYNNEQKQWFESDPRGISRKVCNLDAICIEEYLCEWQL